MEIAIAVENLQRIRNHKGLTYNDLAKITGYSINSIHKLFTHGNDSKSRLDLFVSICRALDIDFSIVFSRGVVTYDSLGKPTYKNFDENGGTEFYLNNFVKKVIELNSDYANYHLTTVSGLSESTISDLFNFKTKNPRMETIIKIKEGLNVSEEEVFR